MAPVQLTDPHPGPQQQLLQPHLMRAHMGRHCKELLCYNLTAHTNNRPTDRPQGHSWPDGFHFSAPSGLIKNICKAFHAAKLLLRQK